MKNKSEECAKLEQEFVDMKANLKQAWIQEDEFRVSVAKLDRIIASQKNLDDKEGLGFEKGESSKAGQEKNVEIKKG